MSYLTKADLEPFIEPDELSYLSQDDDTTIDKAILDAEAEIKAYLSHHYDIPAEFAKTGDDRSRFLVSKGIDMALFYLHRAVPANAMPERRLFFYQEAQGCLDKIKNGEMTLDVDPLKDEEGKPKSSHFLYGSNTKIKSHGY